MNKLNEKRIRFLAFVLFLPVLIDGINTFFKDWFGLSNTSSVTLILTGIVALYGWWLVAQALYRNGFLLYLAILGMFLLNYVLFEKSRPYLFEQSMVLIYVFYLPMSILIVGYIKDWSGFIQKCEPYCYLSAIICVLLIVATDYISFLNYMEYSYAVLPLILLNYVLCRRTKKFALWLSFVAQVVSVLIYGARAPILFAIAFMLVNEMFLVENGIKNTVRILLIALPVAACFVLFRSQILQFIQSYFYDSRFISKLLSDELFVSQGRNEINVVIIRELSNMGLNIYGLFADRFMCNIIYAHNIFFEVWLSFGWIFGTAIMVYIGFKFVWFWINEKPGEKKTIFAILFFGLFCRYLISGSFIIEGRFYICIVALLLISKKRWLKAARYGKDFGMRIKQLEES